jgi:Protein of unknown function (DUF2911)
MLIILPSHDKIYTMKKISLIICVLGNFYFANSQTLKIPQPSTNTTVKQDFALGSIELSYSRPNVKGRKIFGDVVAYDKIWRTGANGATTLTFSDEVTIGGTKVAPGKYGLLTIPNAKEWTLIITKQTDVTSANAYNQEMDVVRVKATPMALPWAMETFTILLDNVKATSTDLTLLWDKTGVTLPITAEIDSRIMKQIENVVVKDGRPYFNAALYYAENGKDLNQAISWFDKALDQNPKAFWIYYQKAKTLSKLNKKTEALVASTKSMELAKEAKNDDYMLLNEKLQKELK